MGPPGPAGRTSPKVRPVFFGRRRARAGVGGWSRGLHRVVFGP